jgi:transcriptional regulator with XRE-family HTH domain
MTFGSGTRCGSFGSWRGLRQSEIAIAAGVAQSTISDVERGQLGGLSVASLRRIFAAVDAGFEGVVRWRGAGLDRLLDARHASLVSASVRRLTALGWETRIETTYSIYGERGSIDVMGARVQVRAVLVEEIKSELASVEETIRKLDEKVRLVRERIAREDSGGSLLWWGVCSFCLTPRPPADAWRSWTRSCRWRFRTADPPSEAGCGHHPEPCPASSLCQISPRAMLARTGADSCECERVESPISRPDIASGDMWAGSAGNGPLGSSRDVGVPTYDRLWRYSGKSGPGRAPRDPGLAGLSAATGRRSPRRRRSLRPGRLRPRRAAPCPSASRAPS